MGHFHVLHCIVHQLTVTVRRPTKQPELCETTHAHHFDRADWDHEASRVRLTEVRNLLRTGARFAAQHIERANDRWDQSEDRFE